MRDLLTVSIMEAIQLFGVLQYSAHNLRITADIWRHRPYHLAANLHGSVCSLVLLILPCSVASNTFLHCDKRKGVTAGGNTTYILLFLFKSSVLKSLRRLCSVIIRQHSHRFCQQCEMVHIVHMDRTLITKESEISFYLGRGTARGIRS